MAQQTLPAFNYAGTDTTGNYLPELKLEEGKKALVSFLENIPGMQNPPFVYCKVHWNSEMGENGRLYQCHGGSCCTQVTWQKGWGGEPGKYEVNKARTRYYIPLIHYCQSESNPAVTEAVVKFLNLTWSAYDVIVKAYQNTTEGLGFFDRDITLESTKVNGATIYQLYKGESKAQWQQNLAFKQQVEEQLPDVAVKLMNSMPKMFTESEFLEIKKQLDIKLQASMQSYNAVQQTGAQAGFGAAQVNVPQMGSLPQPAFTQPQVNIPVQATQPAPVASPVQSIATQPQTQQVETPTVEIPQASLEFDPSALLK